MASDRSMLPSERGRARRPAQGNRIPAHIHHQIIELVLEQSDLSQREAAVEPCAAPAQDVGPLQFDHANPVIESWLSVLAYSSAGIRI